jgi:YD repeat-containing protein
VRQERGEDDDPCLLLNPTYAYVTDENGQVFRFLRLSPPGEDYGVFIAMPTNVVDQDSYGCTLEGSAGTYVFTKRHGTVIHFEPTTIELVLIGDRNHPEQKTALEYHNWSRVTTVSDRFGSQLVYERSAGLVPSSITASVGSGTQRMQIFTDGTRVSGIQDPAGNLWSYDYDSMGIDGIFAPVLTQVTAPAMTTPVGPQSPVTTYDYEIVSEPDSQVINPPPSPPLVHYHLNVTSITDPLGHSYGFEYVFDWSKQILDPKTGLIYVSNGEPRRVKQVTLPDDSVATYQAVGIVAVYTGTAEGARATYVVDAEENGRFYDFGQSQVRIMDEWKQMLWPSSDTRRIPLLVYYPELTVTYYSGKNVTFDDPTEPTDVIHYAPDSGTEQIWQEEFEFDFSAGMALSSMRDGSGNFTSYEHSDPFPPLTPAIHIFDFYSDPTAENREWTYNGATSIVRKTFHYGVFRIMDQMVDEEGRTTVYELDGMGRRLSESIFPPGGGGAIQVTQFAYDAGIAAFTTLHTVVKLGATTGDPVWVEDLVKSYLPDWLGRVAQEIVNPGGLSLTTTHTYDQNSNKRSTQDPNGYFKWFVYDGQNRITTITDEGPGSRNFVYDLRGNKVTEIDENSHSTTFEYDVFNRVVTQTR